MAQDVPTFDWLLKRLTDDPQVAEFGDALAMECAVFIWSNIDDSLDVPTIVRQVPAARRTLERRFRRQFGRTIRQFVAFARLELAKWLLTESSLPIRAIASRAGYSSSDWMGKAVQRATGMVPSDYRRRGSK